MAIRKNKSSSKNRNVFVFLGLVLLLVVLLHSVFGVYKKNVVASEAKGKMRSEHLALQEKHDRLARSLESIKTVEGIEFEIRKKFNMISQGESLAVIVESAVPKSLGTPTESFWDKILFWR